MSKVFSYTIHTIELDGREIQFRVPPAYITSVKKAYVVVGWAPRTLEDEPKLHFYELNEAREIWKGYIQDGWKHTKSEVR